VFLRFFGYIVFFILRIKSLILFCVFSAISIFALSANKIDNQAGQVIADEFLKYESESTWTLINQVKVNTDSYHPQGIILINDHYFITSVRRIFLSGKGYLMEVTRSGELVRELEFGEGDYYHPGGMAFDGEFIWVPLAVYSPNSKALICKVDPKTFKYEVVSQINDHVGTLVYDTTSNFLYGMNWGSVVSYKWVVTKDEVGKVNLVLQDNPIRIANQFMDFQDCKYLYGSVALCDGVHNFKVKTVDGEDFGEVQVGGLELLDLNDMRTIHSITFEQWVAKNIAMTRNPFTVEVAHDKIFFYFMPSNNDSTIYQYTIEK